MIVTEDNGKQMWNAFARTGRVDDYIKYAQHMRELSEQQGKKETLPSAQMSAEMPSDGKENGSAVG